MVAGILPSQILQNKQSLMMNSYQEKDPERVLCIPRVEYGRAKPASTHAIYQEKDPERVLCIPRVEYGRAKPARTHAIYQEKDPERVLCIPRVEYGRAKPARTHAIIPYASASKRLRVSSGGADSRNPWRKNAVIVSFLAMALSVRGSLPDL